MKSESLDFCLSMYSLNSEYLVPNTGLTPLHYQVNADAIYIVILIKVRVWLPMLSKQPRYYLSYSKLFFRIHGDDGWLIGFLDTSFF